MIKLEFADKNEISIDRKEVMRYLGYGKNNADGVTAEVIEKCVCEIESIISCKACFDRFPVSFGGDGSLDLGFCGVTSKNLGKNLRGCDEIILFTATIGIEVDRFIQRYTNISPVRSVIAQAAGAAAIEEWCDVLCSRFAERALDENRFLRPRFSPGYGDLPLEIQKRIFEVLDCSRKIGVTLTDGFLMMPSKSVSAIIGVSDTNLRCIHSGCEVCKNTECQFRRS